MRLSRGNTIPEASLPTTDSLIARGRVLAEDWKVGTCPFLDQTRQPSEAAYKRARAASRQVMQHAQVGFRDPVKSRRAYAEIHEALRARRRDAGPLRHLPGLVDGLSARPSRPDGPREPD